MYNCMLSVFSTESEELAEFAKNPSMFKEYMAEHGPKMLELAIQLVVAIVILVIGMKLIKAFSKFLLKPLGKSKVDPAVSSFLVSLIRYGLDFILVMTILSHFGVSGSVVAILGSAGLTLGLALQGSLANFAGGVLILLVKPFTIGDYVIVKGKDVEGTVADINLFYTRIKTIDNKMVMIPNGGLADSSIVNVTALDKRRVDVKVGVSYTADIAKTKTVLTEVVMSQPTLLKDEPVDIFVDELAESAVIFGVRLWVNNADFFPTKWALNEEIKVALDKNQISIPYNQMDVHIC